MSLDVDKLTERATARLDKSLERAVDTRMTALEERITEHEQRMSTLGVERLSTITARAEKLDERLARTQRVMTLQSIGQLAAALVPFALVIIALAMILGLIGDLFGVGAIAGWLWSSFAAAQAWWAKALWAVGALAFAGGISAVVVWAGRWLHDQYRGW